jgi:DNA-binding LacI/PurR family transcriptional regulator
LGHFSYFIIYIEFVLKGVSMPNIHDVARLAGVHRSTASRVLTGKGSFSEKSRKKVLEAAHKINYHINTVASALKSQRKTAIGLLSFWNCSPNPSEAYYQQTLAGIIDEITRSKYHLLLNNIQGLAHPDNEELEFCHESPLAGILLMAPRVKKEADLAFLKRVSIPSLLLSYRAENPIHSWIDLDNVLGGRLATEHLLQLGHKRIGYVGGELEYSSNARDRYRGFRDALKAAGLREDPELVRNGEFSMDYGIQSARQFLALPAHKRPQALFCATDMIAFGAIEVFQKAGLRVPGDISIVGFDDYERGSHSDPPLTTIHQPFYEIGKKAVQALEEMIKDSDSMPKHVLIEPRLVPRKSTAPPKS